MPTVGLGRIYAGGGGTGAEKKEEDKEWGHEGAVAALPRVSVATTGNAQV